MQSLNRDADLVELRERRAADRHLAVLRVAKIKLGATATLCRIRDISQSGARIETSMPVAVDTVATIEIRSDLKVSGTIVWTSGSLVGLQFHIPVNLKKFLGRGNSRTGNVSARRPRFRTIAQAVVQGLDGESYAVLRDISLEGASFALIESRRLFRVGEQMWIVIDGLPRKRAAVKWIGVEIFGVQFGSPIHYPDLERWLLRFGSGSDFHMQDSVEA